MKTKTPKGYLSYDLSDPAQVQQMHHALNGELYHTTIEGLYDEVFRPHIKYDAPIIGEEELTVKESVVIDAIWNKVYAYFNDKGVV